MLQCFNVYDKVNQVFTTQFGIIIEIKNTRWFSVNILHIIKICKTKMWQDTSHDNCINPKHDVRTVYIRLEISTSSKVSCDQFYNVHPQSKSEFDGTVDSRFVLEIGLIIVFPVCRSTHISPSQRTMKKYVIVEGKQHLEMFKIIKCM